MSRRWLWFLWVMAALGLANGAVAVGLFVWATLDHRWGLAALNLISALVSLGWGSYFLAQGREAQQ